MRPGIAWRLSLLLLAALAVVAGWANGAAAAAGAAPAPEGAILEPSAAVNATAGGGNPHGTERPASHEPGGAVAHDHGSASADPPGPPPHAAVGAGRQAGQPVPPNGGGDPADGQSPPEESDGASGTASGSAPEGDERTEAGEESAGWDPTGLSDGPADATATLEDPRTADWTRGGAGRALDAAVRLDDRADATIDLDGGSGGFHPLRVDQGIAAGPDRRRVGRFVGPVPAPAWAVKAGLGQLVRSLLAGLAALATTGALGLGGHWARSG